MQSACKLKNVVAAWKKAFGYEVRGAAKCMPKHAPRGFQNLARHVPKPFKIETRGGPGSQNAPAKRPEPAEKRPRAPTNCPRGIQQASKRGQEPPQSSQKPAKWRPRETPEGPGHLQNLARRVPRWGSNRNFVGSFVQQAPGAILYRFSASAASLQYVKTWEKPRKNYGFYTSGA